jgi:exopolyphosphatase/pppGpp-phosphohydrolase
MIRAADDALVAALDARPREIVAVGGTASNLLKVAPGGSHDSSLTRARITAALATLMGAPAADITTRFALNPTRARLLPAGAVIVGALLRRYGVREARVSEASLREGAIHVVHHAGRAWRDQLPDLAHGWRS